MSALHSLHRYGSLLHMSYVCICMSLIVFFCMLSHTHARLTALFPGLSGGGISWAILCKSTPPSRQITMPAPHLSVFTGRMPFLPPNQRRQSTESYVVNISLLTMSLTAHLGNFSVRDRKRLLMFVSKLNRQLRYLNARF